MKMTEEETQVLLFGDQTAGFGELKALFKVKENSLLTSFFEKTNFALRQEVGQQPRAIQQLIPRFSSLVDLLARYDAESKAAAVLESTLSTIYQLACVIKHYGEHSRAYPSPSKDVVLGMCTGLLTASAVACSNTLVDLVPLAIEAVLVSFRTGLHVTKIRDLLEKSETLTWSYIVPELRPEEALAHIEAFSQSNLLPISSRPFVSAVGPWSLTISGPPQVLRDFLTSSTMAQYKATPVPIHAPYHAAHLHTQSNIDVVLASLPESVSETTVRLPIISSETGYPMTSHNFKGLLMTSLSEILLKPIRWDRVLAIEAPVWNRVEAGSACTILHVGSSASQSLRIAFHGIKGASPKVQNISHSIPSTESAEYGAGGRPDQSKIAIVGYSGRFPEATSPQGLWDLLQEGRDVHREIPPDRFNVETHYDPTGTKKNTSQVRYGCFINQPGLFDARYFNLSPKEADQSDPGQRLALMTAVEALEMGGIVPGQTPSTQRDRIGIFYGMTSDDWREVNSGQNISTYFIPGGNRAFTPGRINFHFKFLGPSISVDTACSSSAAAIHMACNSLWRNDCDTAIAGGTNVMTNPDNFVGLDKGHFLSRTGNCKTFDDGADGYCRADAVGTVVLKRLEDAITDNDPIQGVIVSAYTNHSAEAESITRPHTGAQSFIFRKLLNDSGHDPADVSYIEMHGTGTQAGDATEMRSVLEVFTDLNSTRKARNPLYLGSVKANVGHAESASGVTSLIKLLLMMKNNEIPPHCGIRTKINRNFPADLAERGIRIAMNSTPWESKGDKRMAFLNNFSAAGGNSALLLEDAPVLLKKNAQTLRTKHIVAVSAQTPASLKNNVQALLEYLNKPLGFDIESLSYTTTARRMHHKYRIIVSGNDLDTIRSALHQGLTREIPPIPRKVPTVAFTFSGQGSQYLGMGKQLFHSFSSFREEILRLDHLATQHGFKSVVPLLDGTGDEVIKTSPQIMQLSQTCLQMALATLWISFGISPSLVVGHSLGEYAALHVAGVLSASDAVYLTGKRAQLLELHCAAGTHAMLAVNTAPPSIAFLEQYGLEIACINGPTQTVLSGPIAAIESAQQSLASSRVKSTRLQTEFAFHSAQVDPILEEFEAAARGVIFHKPTIPVVSPLLETIVTSKEQFSGAYLARHCRQTVNFEAAMRATRESELVTDSTIWLEIGPEILVSGMVKANLGVNTTTAASLTQRGDAWSTLADSLSTFYCNGLDICWNEYHRNSNGLPTVLPLPTYQWDYKNHWIDYKNDWCLTKGELPVVPAETMCKPEFSTITCQRIVQQSKGLHQSSITVESDISHPELRAVFEAHKVNGAMLCPSSVYADIALTLGDHLGKSNPIQANCGVEVASMVTSKPLLMNNPGHVELFQVSALADWSKQTAHVSYYSVNSSGKKTLEHATCTIRFGNPEKWQHEWKRVAHLVRSRIRALESAVEQGHCHRIKRGMVYKMFENCVEYDDKFRGIEEVVLDSQEHEATARVVFRNFLANPYYIDSLGHLSGFVMNATETCDYKTQVYINHGWESMRCTVTLSPSETYTTYVKMENVEGTRYSGDVYILRGDEIVGLNQGVMFQGVPRKVLDMLLPNPSKPVASPSSSTKKQQTQAPLPAIKKVSTETVVAGSNIIVHALKIVSEEIGIAVSEISNQLEFADVGVDSLLSLTITGRFREEMNIDVNSSFFIDYPTVQDMKRFLGEVSSVCSTESSVSSASSSTLSNVFSNVKGTGSVASLDADDFGCDNIELHHSFEQSPMSAICSIAAEEIGVSMEEVWNAQELADLGLDSLMSLTILGRLRDELDIDLPANIFFGNSISAIQKQLGYGPSIPETPTTFKKDSNRTTKNMPPSSSIVLQGSLKTATTVLFLFPDGSGSAASYAKLLRVAPSVAVVGLNCPFMKTPQDLSCALQELTAPYLAEIRRRQPRGPYYLGGWSAGGICAYDAAQVLIAAGEEVASLVLLDSPNPINLSKLPPRMYHFLNSLNMFGASDDAPPPEWLLPHFLAFVDALAQYEPRPFLIGKAPPTYIIWAADGVYRTSGGKRLQEQSDDTREMRWLLNDRTEFGPNGWDQLVGKDNVQIQVLAQANHFTMMEKDRAVELSRFLARAMKV